MEENMGFLKDLLSFSAEVVFSPIIVPYKIVKEVSDFIEGLNEPYRYNNMSPEEDDIHEPPTSETDES
jgi:hypothetical protein